MVEFPAGGEYQVTQPGPADPFFPVAEQANAAPQIECLVERLGNALAVTLSQAAVVSRVLDRVRGNVPPSAEQSPDATAAANLIDALDLLESHQRLLTAQIDELANLI